MSTTSRNKTTSIKEGEIKPTFRQKRDKENEGISRRRGIEACMYEGRKKERWGIRRDSGRLREHQAEVREMAGY